MERTVLRNETLTRTPSRWRLAAGIAVLVALVLAVAALAPPYLRNMEYQRYLDDAVDRNQVPDALVADVVNKAAQIGLPVRTDDVHVSRTGSGLRVDIIYVVHVDLPLYTVDLHFHPSASASAGS